jgi:hypothetical protein
VVLPSECDDPVSQRRRDEARLLRRKQSEAIGDF